jgi:hypothetical protein
MKINTDSYVPVLRWKGAERTALQRLTADVRSSVVPIIEFVPQDFAADVKEGSLRKLAKSLINSCGWNYSFIVDASLLGDGVAASCIAAVCNEAMRYNPAIGIVTGVNKSAQYQEEVSNILSRSSADLVLRVSSVEFRQAGITAIIDEVLARLGTHRDTTHLLLDFGYIDASGMDYIPWLRNLPTLTDWRSVTVLAGTFPKDLGQLAANEEHLLERGEWPSWCELAEAVGVPVAFGDYTIQHPYFKDNEGKGFNFSASIRYTVPRGYLVFRGEGVRNDGSPGYQQYLAEAQLLSERPEFCGGPFSWGDGFIAEKSHERVKTGGPKEWLSAGINHHITFTVREIQRQVGVPVPAKDLSHN